MRRNWLSLERVFPNSENLLENFTIHRAGRYEQLLSSKNRRLSVGSIRPLAGTHGEGRPHVELPQYFLGQDLVSIESLGFACREINAFSPDDSRSCRIVAAAADAVHQI